MRRILIGFAAVALLVPVSLSTTSATAPESAYLGSEACQRCHQPSYDSWRRTLHVQMTKPIAQAQVEGDFGAAAQGRGSSPVRLSQNGRSYSFERRGGRYFITITKAAERTPETFEVHYTLGARRFQGYLSKLPDGRIYVLPVFWHNESKRWVDWKEITPIPDDPDHDLRQSWNVTCGYCHGNKNNVFFGFKPGERYEDYALPFLISQPIPDNDPQGDFWPDGRPSRFNRPQALTLTGCFRKGEATCTSCHRMHGSQNSHSLKVQVETLDGSLTKQSDQLCTQCHVAGSLAGQERPRPRFAATKERRGEASALVRGGAGSPTRHPRWGAGGGAPPPVEKRYSGDAREAAASSDDWSSHTHHAPDSQGSRCIGCHMSDVNWRLITRRRDHTFQPPVPEMMSRFGAPSACNTCHEDKSPEWAAKTMDAWYGNGERRRAVVAAAEILYRAGAGDSAALPEVARLAVDRSRGSLVRASAAEFAGQLIARSSGSRGSGGSVGSGASGGSGEPSAEAGRLSPTIVNALIGAAADPEAIVRIAAVRSLGLISDARVPPVLASHLTDQARLVRVSAAEALTMTGVVQLSGAAGDALARAQDEWAESLRTFNDVAADHTTLGWLEAARGRAAEAEQHLKTAIALDPSDARPHVYLGVIAARAGRFDEAVQHFKTAKTISPAYQNLDRLLEEASRRATR